MTSMASTADLDLRDGRRIMDRDQFIREVSPASHLAEDRLDYYHHSFVVNVGWNGVKIIHYSKQNASAQVHETFLPFDKINFKLGVYLIETEEYPQSTQEKDEAIRRAYLRVKESQYMVAINNCEHFVTWALTGDPLSRQIKDATHAKMLIADTIDAHSKRTFLTSTSAEMEILVEKGSKKVIEKVTSGFVETVGEKTSKTVIETVAKKTGAKVAERTGRAAAKRVGARGVKAGKDLFCKKTAKTAMASQNSTSSVLKATGKAAAVTTIVESVFLGIELIELNKSCNEGHITKREFKRGVITKTTGTVGSIAGSTAGTVIGQILIPVPFIGGFIGGFVGSIVAREVSSLSAGLVFDIA